MTCYSQQKTRVISATMVLFATVFAAACDDPTIILPMPFDSLWDGSVVEPRLSGHPDGRIESPVRLAFTNSNRILVSDYHRKMVIRLDPETLTPDGAFWVDGKPLAVGLGATRIYVGNATTRTIDVFDANGNWQDSFGRPGAVSDPKDLAVDPNLGLVFVLDGAEKELKVFDLNGSLQFTISGPGLRSDRLQNPTAIVLDATRGEVLVSDYGDPARNVDPEIKIFDYNGNHLSSLSGSEGMSGFRFSRPQGLAVDAFNRIYVADAMAGEVLVLDRETGAVLGSVGTYGSDAGQLNLPLDVLVDPETGDIFVASYGTTRVERFENWTLVP